MLSQIELIIRGCVVIIDREAGEIRIDGTPKIKNKQDAIKFSRTVSEYLKAEGFLEKEDTFE
jgi:hypothetical protein